MEQEITRMNKGDFFGEMASIYNTFRTASACAVENTNLFYLEKQYFDSTLAVHIIKTNLDQAHFLRDRVSIIPTNIRIEEFVRHIKPIVLLF